MAGPDFHSMRLSEIIGSLSYALDLTEGQPPGHLLRCAWIGVHIGQILTPEPDRMADLYYTLLLKDAGCTSNAARLWELYGGNDLVTKRDFKTVDSQSLWQLGNYVLRHAGPGERLAHRIKRVLNLIHNGDRLADELIQARCERGAEIVRRLGFGDAVAAAVYALDEHWNGKGRPFRIEGTAIPLNARIALLAQVAEVFHTVGGPAAARAEVSRRSGTWFDPSVVEAFRVACAEDRVWAGLAADGLDERVAACEPLARVIRIDEDRLDAIAEAFADIVDAKSSFTVAHSRRVTRYTDAIAAALGVSDERRRWLRRAALLHDIGKLGVSSGVLEKPGRLEPAEWNEMRRHAVLTEEILSRVSVFRDIAPIAAAHHERIDGNGYPKRLRGDAITLEMRIIAVSDTFDAITAGRPYRPPFSVEAAIDAMERSRDAGLDGGCLNALWGVLPTLDLTA